MMTTKNVSVSDAMVANYFNSLVNKFFKILPLKERNEASLKKYMLSMQTEMLGLHGLIVLIDNDPAYLSLLAILEYLIDYDCSVADVKREVFKAISLCKTMLRQYSPDGGDVHE